MCRYVFFYAVPVLPRCTRFAPSTIAGACTCARACRCSHGQNDRMNVKKRITGKTEFCLCCTYKLYVLKTLSVTPCILQVRALRGLSLPLYVFVPSQESNLPRLLSACRKRRKKSRNKSGLSVLLLLCVTFSICAPLPR